jgi:hypothetical protein
MTEIYEKTKQAFPTLCDDNYLCSQNCSKGGNHPEWKHVVRKVIEVLKKKENIGVNKSDVYGSWIFS